MSENDVKLSVKLDGYEETLNMLETLNEKTKQLNDNLSKTIELLEKIR